MNPGQRATKSLIFNPSNINEKEEAQKTRKIDKFFARYVYTTVTVDVAGSVADVLYPRWRIRLGGSGRTDTKQEKLIKPDQKKNRRRLDAKQGRASLRPNRDNFFCYHGFCQDACCGYSFLIGECASCRARNGGLCRLVAYLDDLADNVNIDIGCPSSS